MLDLPESTLYGRRIPKQKFYENLSVTPQLKRVFIEQIDQVLWRNKIAPDTVNIAPGHDVTEIEVFEIRLNQLSLSQNNQDNIMSKDKDKKKNLLSLLQLIDQEIPYHILFLLIWDDEVQAWMGYKEENKTKGDACKAVTYYNTEWMPFDELTLRLEGLNMDAVYEGFLRQIAGEQLEGDRNIKDAVNDDERRKKLDKEIAALEKKVQREKQFNAQVTLNSELKVLREELRKL